MGCKWTMIVLVLCCVSMFSCTLCGHLQMSTLAWLEFSFPDGYFVVDIRTGTNLILYQKESMNSAKRENKKKTTNSRNRGIVDSRNRGIGYSTSLSMIKIISAASMPHLHVSPIPVKLSPERYPSTGYHNQNSLSLQTFCRVICYRVGGGHGPHPS